MLPLPLSWNAPLAASSRCLVAIPAQGDEIGAIGWRDALGIVVAGIATALCVNFIEGSFKIPGHAIFRSILPLSCGIALVPRRMAGSFIGLTAFLTTLTLQSFGFEIAGLGARMSMFFIGPAMDIALWYTRGGWWVYWQCALAGLAANLAAFQVRAFEPGDGGGSGAPVIFNVNWPSAAPWTFAACGLLTGFVSGILWFHWTIAPPAEVSTSA